MDGFLVSYEFAEKYIRFSNPEYIQVYLYVSYKKEKDGKVPTIQQVATELDISCEHAAFVLDFWVSRGELRKTKTGYSFPEPEAKPAPQRNAKPEPVALRRQSRPSYTMAEIDTVATRNKAISGLFYQAETVLQKVLTQSDMEMLYSFVDWLGLPVEVITMLLSYGVKRGKTGRRYLETVAMDWAERGIDTFEAAEAHVMELEERDSTERKICSILGIFDRALTATEKKYIKQWAEMPGLSLDLVPVAYDRTVSRTGKLSWSYMNKILKSWAEEGLTTEKQVLESEEAYRGGPSKKAEPGPKPSRLNNYSDTNSVDYDVLEEQLLDLMLDDGMETR